MEPAEEDTAAQLAAFKFRASTFAHHFGTHFCSIIDRYTASTQLGKKGSDPPNRLASVGGMILLGAAGAGAGIGITPILAGALGVAIPTGTAASAAGGGGSKLGDLGMNYLYNKFSYSKKAKTVVKFVRQEMALKKDLELVDRTKEQQALIQILVEAAVELVEMYEYQLLRIVDNNIDKALEKLAIDAANRAVNYIKESGAAGAEARQEEFGADFVVKAVLQGASKKTTMAKLSASLLGQKGHTLRTAGDNKISDWNTAQLLGDVAVLLSESVYTKPNTDTTMGYRLAANFEASNLDKWLQKSGYQKASPVFSNEMRTGLRLAGYSPVASHESLTQIGQHVLHQYRKVNWELRFDGIDQKLDQNVGQLEKIVDKQEVHTGYLEEIKQKLDAGPVDTHGDHEAALEPRPGAVIGNFVGRSAETAKLLAALEGGQRKVLVTGLPGVGKSEFVRHAMEVEELRHFQKSWLTGDIAESLLLDIMQLASSLGIGIEDGPAPKSTLELTKCICAKMRDSDWIVVLDNIDKGKPNREFVEVVKTITGSCTNSVVIITSRNMKFGAGECVLIPLRELDPEDAKEFVRKELEPVEGEAPPRDEDIEKLCVALQNFPLALQTAAAMIRKLRATTLLNNYGIPEYLRHFEESAHACLQESLETSPYSLSTFIALKASIDEAGKGPSDGQLLNLLSFLLPDRINLQYLKRLHSSVYNEETDMASSLNNLKILNLITQIDQNTIRVHRLIQEVARILMAHPPEPEELSLFGKAIEKLKSLAAHWLRVPSQNENDQILDAIISGVADSDWRDLPPDEVMQLVSIWGHAAKIDALLVRHSSFPFGIFKALAKYSMITDAHQFSLITSSKFAHCPLLDEMDEERVRMEFAFAKALKKKGEYQEAYDRVRGLYDKLLAESAKSEEELINTYGQDMASLLCYLKRPEEALEWNDKLLAVRGRLYPAGHPEHRRVVRILANKGMALGDAGRHEEALYHFEEALEFFTGDRGPESDSSLMARHNIARTQALLGNYSAAIPELREVYRLRLGKYGDCHKDIMRTEYWLAYSLYHGGEGREYMEEAKGILTSLSARQRGVLGYGHHHTVDSKQLLELTCRRDNTNVLI